jgi:integrase
LHERSEIDVNRTSKTVPTRKSFWLRAFDIPKRVADVVQIKIDAAFLQARPDTTPVSQEMVVRALTGLMAVRPAECFFLQSCGLPSVAPHDLRRTCARLCHQAGGELDQIQFLLGHVSTQTTERYLGCKQRFHDAVNDHIGLEPDAPS